MENEVTYVIQVKNALGEWYDARDGSTDSGSAAYSKLENAKTSMVKFAGREHRIVRRIDKGSDEVID